MYIYVYPTYILHRYICIQTLIYTILAHIYYTGKLVSVLAWLECILQFIEKCPDLLPRVLFVLPLTVFGFFALL